jgi:hypothetical protein
MRVNGYDSDLAYLHGIGKVGGPGDEVQVVYTLKREFGNEENTNNMK